jgi:hypothetical protein
MGSNIKFNFKNTVFLFILFSFLILLTTLSRFNNSKQYYSIKNKNYDGIITEKYIDMKKYFNVDKVPSVTGNKNTCIFIYTYVHAYIYTYVHVYTHIQTNT